MSRLSLLERTKYCKPLKISDREKFRKRLSEERWLRDNYSLIRMVILTLLRVESNFHQIMIQRWEINWCRQSKMFTGCKTQSKEIDNNLSRQLSYPKMAIHILIIPGSNRLIVFQPLKNLRYSIRGFNRIYLIRKETKKTK